jgi:hypothetical protein
MNLAYSEAWLLEYVRTDEVAGFVVHVLLISLNKQDSSPPAGGSE